MISITVTAIVSFLAVGFVFFYTPTPDGMPVEDQWLMRKQYAFNQAGKIVARIGSLVGYDSAINITRRFRNLIMASITQDTFDIQSKQFIFDGVSVTVHQKTAWTQATNSEKDRLRPAVFYIHGGGWTYKSPELYAVLERYLVNHLDIVVVSVDYRLAPEHPYPAPFQDCVASIKHFHKNSRQFGVDPKQISVVGDSAGGNLAAAVAIKLRDDGENFLQTQILFSPATQCATFRMESFNENDKYGILSKRSAIQYWLLYTNQTAQYLNELNANEHVSEKVAHHAAWPFLQKYQKFPQDHVKIDEKVSRILETKLLDSYLCPMMADSLGALAPALVLVSEFDVMRDDALAYADRLKAEGTPTLMVKSNGFHGIYRFFGQSVSGGEMVQSMVDYLRDVYENYENHENSANMRNEKNVKSAEKT